MSIEDGQSQITCSLPPKMLQYAIKEASEKGEWTKLRLLFLGTAASNTSRGLAYDCDASCVPLDLLIQSDVKDLHTLVTLLLQRGASPTGLRGCVRAPLLVAMEMMKFPVAVTLLRNNADPSCIVGHGIFINREGQPKQWLQLGRKALDANDNKKAVMLLNMSLYLSESNTEKSILLQIYNGLSEAHFNLNENERSIDAGNEYFKLRPIKSEDEAKRWEVRAAHAFESSAYTFCIDYVNLALKYTPADCKQTFSLLLCQRSQAFQQLGDYERALEDAKTASMMNPDMSEGYRNQLYCFRALKRGREAMQVINECLKRTSDENTMYDNLSDALDIAVNLQEATSALTVPVPSQLIEKLTSGVIQKRAWHKLLILYLGGGGPTSQPIGDGGLATDTDASSVPLGEIIRCTHSDKLLQLVSVLLRHGASANAIEGSAAIPLDEALTLRNLALVEKLIHNGANPCVLGRDREPIIHQALRIDLRDKNGNFRYLKAMLISKTSEIKNVQNAEGDSLYHLACTGRRPTSNKCEAIRILREANVNPNLPNKANKSPNEILHKNDSRCRVLYTALESYNSSTSLSFQSATGHQNISTEEQDKEYLSSATGDDDSSGSRNDDSKQEKPLIPAKDAKVRKVEDKQQMRTQMRENVDGLITTLLPLDTLVPEDTNEDQEDNEDFNEPSEVLPMTENDERLTKHEDEIPLKRTEYDNTNIDDIEIGGGDVEADIDSKSPFEDLPWEVDCTDRVWKVMRSKRVDNCMRRRIINKIRMLANGRWNTTMCKRLEGAAKKADIQLYESKLTKSYRIIWEKTIAFSGRCSENPELRLNMRNPAGRIYSDIIRVWDIVLDHDKLQSSIEHVVKSHDRGMDCIIRKKLKGITMETKKDILPSSECLPNRYAEIADLRQVSNPRLTKDGTKKSTASDNLSQIFFPPASSNEQEYHILKFYSFSTALVKTVLESDTSSKIDFPFKITELEHAIVNLRPDPPIPIILLGRSGTGKTTCCLYRLWDNFKRYWESAVTAGPHIPRCVPPMETTRFGPESVLIAAADQDVDQTSSSQDKSPLAFFQCQQFNISVDPGLASSSKHVDHVHTYQSAYPRLSKEEIQYEENNPDEVSQTQMYEHLHQVFITKNTVLCSEVEKNFKELCHACPAAEHRQPFEEQPIPPKIQDVAEEAWPLFVNSRDWLLMLDASLPGEPFFKRAEDGSLLRKIEGWGEEDNHLQFIPAMESDDDRSDNEEEEEEDVSGTGKGNRGVTGRSRGQGKEERDPRREITYQLFQAEIWPKMKKSSREKSDYHPTLVWTEIRSFIKGSAEALLSENGVLSLQDYESLGKKKAPNFSADRKVVYNLFCVYQREHSSNRMFDEADLVFNIHRRLQRIPAPEWSIHQFYVDETQDFTQAELSLLIRCCRFPNNLFFTGDTAQSIMRGIAFRFDDLKSLFHHAKKAAGMREDHHDFIRVPKKLYQLTHNYRSHAGILRLASSVVDLLLHYFGDSFDKLQKDEGLFEGPKPVVLESCSPADLAMILQGNQRQSSRIEFGAHQVVLVVSNEARETMPVELKHGLVMTIFEAKGLEFDDVLIYNFFKDSQADKEWRVVTNFMKDQNVANCNVSSSTGLVEITEDSVSVLRSRPLEFDPEKHKVLNSEFKFLYTAITRARVNVWLFDEDKESRAPVFEYFQRLGLVKVVAVGEKKEGSSELANMFAAKSAPEEWRKGGIRFYKHGLWVPAIQCFTFAGDKLMLQKSQAQQQAAEATKLGSTNRQQMRDEFLRAAESFLKCHMHDEAEICLNNAREWVLLAKLYKKTGKLQDAARLFKRKRLYKEASKCYESQNNYAEAIETFCQAGLYEDALSALERFNILSKSGHGREGIIPPRSTRTVERLRHQLADQHFKRGQTKEMEDVLQHLPSTSDRIAFLKKRGCIFEAARALEDDGRREEAARLLRDTGRFKEAVKYSNDPKFAADCLMAQVRTTMEREDTPEILQRSLEKYQHCGDTNGQAEASLMLGKLKKDIQKLQEAGKLFDKCRNFCGEAESVAELLVTTNYEPPKNFGQWITVRALERLLRLVTLLYRPFAGLTLAEQNEITKCEEHFGLFKTDAANKKRFFCKWGGRFAMVDPEFININTSNTEAMIDTAKARQKIGRFLINFSVHLVTKIRTMLETTLSKHSMCMKVAEGTLCDNASCAYQHQLQDSVEHFSNRFYALFHFMYLESVVESFTMEMVSKEQRQDASPLELKDFHEFRMCQRFYKFLFPSSGYREFHLTSQRAYVQNLRMTKAVTKRILQFANVSWKEVAEEKRRSDTDNFLKVSSCLQLIGSDHLMVRWICEEEKEFLKKKARNPTFRPTNYQLAKNGMVGPSPKAESGGHRYESYLQWWEDGKRRLYVHGDVENAAHLIIRRFLTLTAKRHRMIYPSIANTIMILEHQLTACLALYSRLCTEHPYPVCLPGSYLTMVRFWDTFRPGVEKGTYTLYEAIEHNFIQESDKGRLFRAVCSLLNYMVKLACGEVAPSFDLLGDALNSEDTPAYCTSGEAERTLVLFLTMLCNCGKGISTSLDAVMLRKIFRIDPNPHLASRINNVIEEIQKARGCCDVVVILKKFLQGRGERLYDLCWHSGKLWQDGPSNPASYSKSFQSDVSLIREELQRGHQQDDSFRDTETETADGKQNAEDYDTAGDLDNMDVEHTEDELQEREKALLEMTVTAMQKLFKRKKFIEKIILLAGVLREKRLRRLESIEEQTRSSSNVLKEHFSHFKVDSSGCGICGTNFKLVSTDDRHSMSHADNEEEPQEDTAEEALPDEGIENVEAHKKTPWHFQKLREFHQYQELYLTKLLPCLTKEEELNKTLDNPFLSGKREQVALDLERLEGILSSVKKEVQTIESSLDWKNCSSLIAEIKNFQDALRETERIVEQAKQDSFTDENEDGELDLEDKQLHEDNTDEGGEEEEENSPLKSLPGVKKKGRKPKQSHHKRKK
ncbi:TPR and ankyrin repeat-containing protein 1-like isoform X4 [Acropora palmata]